MIQIQQANNPKYNTSNSSLELKKFLDQIASTENLREQIVNQIYIITNIQKAINDNSIKDNLDKFLLSYNDSISNINGAIISSQDKLCYFDIKKEKSTYEKQQFTMKLANKCQEVEVVFDKVASLNAKAIKEAKLYISSQQQTTPLVDFSQNININNTILANNTV